MRGWFLMLLYHYSYLIVIILYNGLLLVIINLILIKKGTIKMIDGDDMFDFNKESEEFIHNNFLTSISFSNVIPGLRASFSLETLESIHIQGVWTTQGIQITSIQQEEGMTLADS